MGEKENGDKYQGSLLDSEIEASKRKNQQGKRSNFVEDEESMMLSQSFALDPIKIELNRLTDQIRGKSFVCVFIYLQNFHDITFVIWKILHFIKIKL